jgi:HPt (histidine-containing phosphotransfer) domain-containing protein
MHAGGMAQGSSIENVARGTASVGTGIAEIIAVRRAARHIACKTGRGLNIMVDMELDELKREFLAEANEKVREIQEKLGGEQSPDVLDRLTYLAHQLKGSGGSYGFQQISTDAAEFEKAVELRARDGVQPGIDDRIQKHVFNLRAEVDRGMKELSLPV